MSFLELILVSFSITLFILVIMSIGVIFGRNSIKGSCGGQVPGQSCACEDSKKDTSCCGKDDNTVKVEVKNDKE